MFTPVIKTKLIRWQLNSINAKILYFPKKNQLQERQNSKKTYTIQKKSI